MNKTLRILMSTAILALSACSPLIYGKLDDSSVAVTQKGIGPVPAYTGPAVTVPANLLSFPFEIGNVTVDQSSKDSSIKLNGAMVAIEQGSNANFNGINQFEITLTPPGGAAQVVAKYDRAANIGTNDGKTITLVPTSDLELLSFLNDTSLSVSMNGSGTPPNVAWTGDLTLDFHIVAQKNIL